MIKLIVFDWNGALIADTQAAYETDTHVWRMIGRRGLDFKTYTDTIRIPVSEYYREHGISKERLKRLSRKISDAFHPFYEARAKGVRTRRNARALLEWIRRRGIEAIILSNHTTEGLESQLRRLKLEKFFSAVLTNSSKRAVMKKRNKKERLIEYLRKSSFKKNEILMLGDWAEEAEAGKRAGIRTIAITGGYYSTRRLKAAKPDHLIHNLAEMIPIIKKLSS